ncbi:MAG: NAD(P)-dependent alcohol dehydrogenase [Frankia sp.]
MRATGALSREPGEPLRLEQVDLAECGPDDVLIRMVASGVCHTDITVAAGLLPFPFPAVLGHEGAGVIKAVGSAVGDLSPGQHAVLLFPSCGQCITCRSGHPARCERGEMRWTGRAADGSAFARGVDGQELAVRFLGQSSFGSYALVHRSAVLTVDDDLPLDVLAPFGCGVMTGAGAIMNVARPTAGERVLVLGAGAVGLSAVMAAVQSGVEQIVCLDRDEQRLKLATDLGATGVIDTRGVDDLPGAIRSATGGRGADIAIECTGAEPILSATLEALAPAGRCVLIGASGASATVTVPVTRMIAGNYAVVGSTMGDGSHAFLRTLIDLYREGCFPVDRMMRTYPFSAVNRALEDARSGVTVKPVLTFPEAVN